MKNIEPFPISVSSFQEIDDNIYTDGKEFFIGLSFEQEPELEEGSLSNDISQYPLEDILDKFCVSIYDFCEESNSQKNKKCKLVFSGTALENIKGLKSIIGKHVYNKIIESNGREIVDLIIE